MRAGHVLHTYGSACMCHTCERTTHAQTNLKADVI